MSGPVTPFGCVATAGSSFDLVLDSAIGRSRVPREGDSVPSGAHDGTAGPRPGEATDSDAVRRQEDHREWWQGQRERPGPAVGATADGLDPAEVAQAAAAVAPGRRGWPARPSGRRRAPPPSSPSAGTGVRLATTSTSRPPGSPAALAVAAGPAQERQHAGGRVRRVDPLEAGRRRSRARAAPARPAPAGSGSRPSAGCPRARRRCRIHHGSWSSWSHSISIGHVVAHEQQLLARLAVLVAEQGAQVGELLPPIAGHLRRAASPSRARPRRGTAAA